MKPNELRIGNILIDRYLGNTFKIASIVKDKEWSGGYYVEDEGGNQTSILWLKPIPITEELLLKAGFAIHGEVNTFFAKEWGRNGVEIIKLDEYYKKYTYQLGKGFVKVLEYANQLQNLYFDLTGEELNIDGVPNIKPERIPF